jgi:hypothetical protein
VQRLLTEESLAGGRRIVGHKIGLTSPAVQRQLGVDQPDSGVLFADMQVGVGATVPTDTLLQPRIEAEIAFILAEDLDGGLCPVLGPSVAVGVRRRPVVVAPFDELLLALDDLEVAHGRIAIQALKPELVVQWAAHDLKDRLLG